jgi:hypothetical protein
LISFGFVIKQKLTTKEISIFGNSSHFEWRAVLSDTILKRDHPRTRPNDFDLQLGCCISDAFSIFFNNKKEEKHKAL